MTLNRTSGGGCRRCAGGSERSIKRFIRCHVEQVFHLVENQVACGGAIVVPSLERRPCAAARRPLDPSRTPSASASWATFSHCMQGHAEGRQRRASTRRPHDRRSLAESETRSLSATFL